MLSEYLHEGIQYIFGVWLSDRYSEHIAEDVIARHQNLRAPFELGSSHTQEISSTSSGPLQGSKIFCNLEVSRSGRHGWL